MWNRAQKTRASFPTRINAAAVHLKLDKSLVHIHGPHNACSHGKHLTHLLYLLPGARCNRQQCLNIALDSVAEGRALSQRGLLRGMQRRHLVGLLGLDKGGWQRGRMVGRSWRVGLRPLQDAPTCESNCPAAAS
jgi:hypothetical protein